jgi:hypothetical protein
VKPGGGLIGAGAGAGATGVCACGWDCCGRMYCWGGAMGLEACSGWKDDMFEEKEGAADLDG